MGNLSGIIEKISEMTFIIKGDSFYLNDKKVFLNSGEIHYFRIRRRTMEKASGSGRRGRFNHGQHIRSMGMARSRSRVYLILTEAYMSERISKAGFGLCQLNGL